MAIGLWGYRAGYKAIEHPGTRAPPGTSRHPRHLWAPPGTFRQPLGTRAPPGMWAATEIGDAPHLTI
eukprot:7457822-Pyramimonas_sp.AAC.1